MSRREFKVIRKKYGIPTGTTVKDMGGVQIHKVNIQLDQ